jgi:hypothetical protein
LSERIAEKREEEEMKVKERERTLKEISVMNKKNA